MTSDYLEILRQRAMQRVAENNRTTPRGAQIVAKAQALARKQQEQQRLIQTLAYYEWLAARGIDWALVNGVKIDTSRAYAGARSGGPSYNLRMVDGSEQIIHAPPFDEAVIFNRSYLPDDPALAAQDGDDQYDQSETQGSPDG